MNEAETKRKERKETMNLRKHKQNNERKEKKLTMKRKQQYTPQNIITLKLQEFPCYSFETRPLRFRVFTE